MQDFEPCHLASAAADDQLEEEPWRHLALPAPLATRLPSATRENEIANYLLLLANQTQLPDLRRSVQQDDQQLLELGAKR